MVAEIGINCGDIAPSAPTPDGTLSEQAVPIRLKKLEILRTSKEEVKNKPIEKKGKRHIIQAKGAVAADSKRPSPGVRRSPHTGLPLQH